MVKEEQNKLSFAWALVIIVLTMFIFGALKIVGGFGEYVSESKIERFTRKHNISLEEYPKELLDLMNRNSETEDFVLNYPLNKDKDFDINLDEYKYGDSVPLLMQWDERWGYEKYGSNMIAISGCGPTCLSMVAIYLTHDTSLNPKAIAEFSTKNGFAISGNGTSWTLMSQGGVMLGMRVTEIPLDEDRVIKNLKLGYPIVCIMGPGDFTSTGHYIVMVGCEDGKIKINDPNSRANSKKLWNFNDIKEQIRNLWVFRPKEK